MDTKEGMALETRFSPGGICCWRSGCTASAQVPYNKALSLEFSMGLYRYIPRPS